MTAMVLKEHGRYVGYGKGIGYVYQKGNSYYAISKNGVSKLV